MMPVVRISDDTWERLKVYARPLEDTADDVIKRALDALEAKAGKTRDSRSVPNPKPKRTSESKLPQKDFRAPLLLTLRELGGAAEVSKIRRRIEPKVKPHLRSGDYVLVSSGEPRWWNATCWERADLVREGLLEPMEARGVWKLSAKGWEAAKLL